MEATTTTIARWNRSRRARLYLLRHSRWDALLVLLALAHGLLLLLMPSIAVIGIGLWWNTNTIGHNFIHLPFFQSRGLNAIFSGYLSVLTGVPQTLWRERHLAHHRTTPWRLRWSNELALESLMVLTTWALISALAPRFFLLVYVPGYLLGLALCQVQGHYEHAQGTTSHYCPLYNLLFFNDGFHAEHHARPGQHWTRLHRESVSSPASRWPAVLRWLDARPLEALERLVLRSPVLQRFVLQRHERAWSRLLRKMPAPRRVTIVGGGLFPRTALVLKKLTPEAKLIIVDAVPAHIETANHWLNGSAEYRTTFYTQDSAQIAEGSDLVVFPLSFQGAKHEIYERPPAKTVVVHDWIWRPRGQTAIVSWLLLKRLNLVSRPRSATFQCRVPPKRE
jgi:hypothetical protein